MRAACLLAVPFLCLASLRAQTIISGSGAGGEVHLFNSDLQVLEMGEPRNDLPCTVVPDKPQLGFDMRFHAGYEVSVPLNDLAGSDNLLTILFRVSAEGKKDKPRYFTERVRVPFIDEDSKGDATLQGVFDTGPGKYKIAWLMRDRSERVCASDWDADAVPAPKDEALVYTLREGQIEQAASDQFREEPPVHRSLGEALNVKVLMNFAPQSALSSTLQPVDTSALVSILRTISREPKIGRFSLTAFNLQTQKVLYRQEGADRIDFPALGEALNSIKLGTVGVSQLADKHGDTDFLTNLIRQEAGSPAQHPDALVFAGPKVMLDENISPDSLKQLGELSFPVFYMNYNRNPQAVPWRDSIGRAVKFFRGYEYTISRPRDLFFAVNEMVSHIIKSRNEKVVSAISSH